jgi:hypothetical protein
MLIEAHNGQLFWQEGFEFPETRLSHVAKSGIMGSTLCIVPVGDHHKVQSEMTEDVESFYPVKGLTYPVDLVNR